MIIAITNGEVEISDICTRKIRKEIDKALYEKASFDNDGKMVMNDLTVMDTANDLAMVKLIKSIKINGEEKQVSVETLDEMDSRDVDLIITEINRITKKEIPKA